MSSKAVFLGVHGDVVALDRETGKTLWQTDLKGGDFVNVLLDGDRIIATTKGEVFCLDALTGQILWKNTLPGMGLGLITIATTSGATSTGPLSEKLRQEAAAQSAAVTGS